ncbi:HAD-IA family hydrolase [Microbulbifer sp. SAOS-129_SWC]|uniref:HAD family hydrolase n=1 Tax=Microbulbifer sp. SAOS-129_SWC TaxID=3145235 RepID=UPI00321726B0
MHSEIELVLFDLGGVLVDLRPTPFPEEWLPDGQTFDDLDWFKSDTAQQFECGTLTPQQFAVALQRELGVKIDTRALLAEFTRWPIGLRSGAHELLISLRQHCNLAALTNTNALHWPRLVDEFRLPPYFDAMFASHQMQLAKPDPRAFRQVSDTLGTAPERILFFDDNAANIAAAAALGLNGRRVTTIAQIANGLREYGVPVGA